MRLEDAMGEGWQEFMGAVRYSPSGRPDRYVRPGRLLWAVECPLLAYNNV
jgi:hypothetical protein